MCVNSRCTLEYGYPTAFSPCNPAGINSIPGSYLFGELVAVPETIDATALGIIGLSGTASAVMAIYTDANPPTLVAQTVPTSIGDGDNQLALTSTVQLNAGTSYWIMVDLSAAVSVCADNTTNGTLFIELPYGSALPGSLGGTTNGTAVEFNFYVVGHQ
jgi:hypothetical protein